MLRKNSDGVGGLSHAGSQAEVGRKASEPSPQGYMELFLIIQQLAVSEAALWSILDGLKSNVTYVSFFCREYWGTSASQAPLSIERLDCSERLKRQVQQACVLESLSMGVVAHLCSGVMQGVSVTIQNRLRNLLHYIHENCLVLMDMVVQRWLNEGAARGDQEPALHCPENLNFDILVRVKRYRRLQRGAHLMALRQHNEMIANVLRQLCRGATTKKPVTSSRTGGTSPGGRSPGGSPTGRNQTVLSLANDVLGSRNPLERMRSSTIRSKMLQCMRFAPLLANGTDPDCPWPAQDPYIRYGAHRFSLDAPLIWFEPLPPMYPDLEMSPKLPPVASPDLYTLVLDLDETLVHYYEEDGMGNFDMRPGMHEFLQRMHTLGFEVVVFTAATQDYADWVMDQIDPDGYIHYRLYRQHALPWGPIFIKDLSLLGRDLDRTLIIDNVQENFMLQPNNGIFILPWYDDPHDTSLYSLSPLLEELIRTRVRVPDLLDKYRDQIPAWAGFDQYVQFGGDYSDLVGGMSAEFYAAQQEEDERAQMQAMLAHSYSSPVSEVPATPPPPPPANQQLQQSQSAPCTASYYMQNQPAPKTAAPPTERSREQEAFRPAQTQPAIMTAVSSTPSPVSSPYAGGMTATLSAGFTAASSPSPAYLHAARTQTSCSQATQQLRQTVSSGTDGQNTLMLQVGAHAPARTQQRTAVTHTPAPSVIPPQTSTVHSQATYTQQPAHAQVRSTTATYHTLSGVTGPGPYQAPQRTGMATMTPASSPGVTTRSTAQAQPQPAFLNRAGFGPHQLARQ